jgi:hypothetical protein
MLGQLSIGIETTAFGDILVNRVGRPFYLTSFFGSDTRGQTVDHQRDTV